MLNNINKYNYYLIDYVNNYISTQMFVKGYIYRYNNDTYNYELTWFKHNKTLRSYFPSKTNINDISSKTRISLLSWLVDYYKLGNIK